MDSADQSTESIVASIKAIATHQNLAAVHHAACLADAEKFKLSLKELVKESPTAVKQYFDDPSGIDGMRIVIESGHIVGYQLHGSWGFVNDAGLADFTGSLALKRIKRCDSRSK